MAAGLGGPYLISVVVCSHYSLTASQPTIPSLPMSNGDLQHAPLHPSLGRVNDCHHGDELHEGPGVDCDLPLGTQDCDKRAVRGCGGRRCFGWGFALFGRR